MKFLTVSQLEEQGVKGSVWVLNTASTSAAAAVSVHGFRGNVIVSIPKLNGNGGDPLIIQESWLPFDASSKFPKERLLESSEFRSAINSGLLSLVDPVQAQKILEREGAREEQQRLLASDRHVRQAGTARTISDSNVDMYVPNSQGGKDKDDEDLRVDVYGQDYEEVNVAKAALAGIEDNDGYKPSFLMFVDKIKAENDISALNAIRTRSKFSRKELRFIRDNLKNHPKAVAAVKSFIAASKVAK